MPEEESKTKFIEIKIVRKKKNFGAKERIWSVPHSAQPKYSE